MRIESFELQDGLRERVEYVETMNIRSGVVCDVYRFTADGTRDLAIVEVSPGHETPRQRVVGGEETIEGRLKGQGLLTVVSTEGHVTVYEFRNDETPPVSVGLGEQMQWRADTHEPLVFFEICRPPYAEGRFENLPD